MGDLPFGAIEVRSEEGIDEFRRETRTAEVLFSKNIARYIDALIGYAFEMYMIHFTTGSISKPNRESFTSEDEYLKYIDELFASAAEQAPRRKKLEKFFRRQEERVPRIFYKYLIAGNKEETIHRTNVG